MRMTKLEAIIKQCGAATDRLADVLAQEKNEFMRDSAIQRFEFTFDLAWKLVKAFLEERGRTCTSPKECFRIAYQEKLTDYDTFWLTLTDMRNKTVHTYREALAEEVYVMLPQALERFQALLRAVREASE